MLYFYDGEDVKVVYSQLAREKLGTLKQGGHFIKSITRDGRRHSPEEYLFTLESNVDAVFKADYYETGHSHLDWEATYNLFMPWFPKINKIINSLQYPYNDHVDLSYYAEENYISEEERQALIKLFIDIKPKIRSFTEQTNYFKLLPKISDDEFERIARANEAVINNYSLLPKTQADLCMIKRRHS